MSMTTMSTDRSSLLPQVTTGCGVASGGTNVGDSAPLGDPGGGSGGGGSSSSSSLTILVQNLQKKPGLAGALAARHAPDVLLAQEINLSSEDAAQFGDAHHTSRMGYGTAIRCGSAQPANVRRVTSPVAELGGFVRKKTTVAECAGGVECVSFHGYNGTPFRDVQSLVAHVQAVVAVLGPGAAIFAGDFNTWTAEHLEAVSAELCAVGFQLAFSWPYPGRDHPLDHAFLRGLKLLRSTTLESAADHLGAMLVVTREAARDGHDGGEEAQ